MKRRRRSLGNDNVRREPPKGVKRPPPPQLGPRHGPPPGVPGFKGQRCNVAAIDVKIADVRRTCKPKRRFKPLFDHVLNLAADSARHGYCQRAGREIRHAKKVASY